MIMQGEFPPYTNEKDLRQRGYGGRIYGRMKNIYYMLGWGEGDQGHLTITAQAGSG